MIAEIKTEQEYQELVQKYPKMLFKFGASWCAPCKRIQSGFEQLANKYSPMYGFASVDMDAAIDIEDINEVKTVPTFMLYVDGNPYAILPGTDLVKIEKVLIE